MIVKEELDDGRVRTYSDRGLWIRQTDTGAEYEEAIDTIRHEYEETDKAIEYEPSTEDKAEAFDILMGVSE